METPKRNEKFSKKTEFGIKLINELVKANITFEEKEQSCKNRLV